MATLSKKSQVLALSETRDITSHIYLAEKKCWITDSSFRTNRLVFAVDQGFPPFYACEMCFWAKVFIAHSIRYFYKKLKNFLDY